MAIKTSSAKGKGRELQKWACEQISKITGYEWGKDKPIESRGMGQSGVDVRMEEKVLALFPFCVECKRHESWSVHNWIKQAIANQEEGKDWLIIARRSREKAVAILDAEAFFEIYQELIERRKQDDRR